MAAAVPTVSVSPNPVAPGQNFTVTISGLSPNKTVYPTFFAPIPISQAQNAQPAIANTAGVAVWTSTILQSTTFGNYTLQIFDADVGSVTATKVIQVQPIQTYTRRIEWLDQEGVSMHSGSVITIGETCHVGVFDFPANTRIDVLIQSQVIASFTTAFNGAGTTSFTINSVGTYNLRVNEHGSSTDYGAISITVQNIGDPDPNPVPGGDIDPLWIVGGVVLAAGVAFAATGGLKRIPKIL